MREDAMHSAANGQLAGFTDRIANKPVYNQHSTPSFTQVRQLASETRLHRAHALTPRDRESHQSALPRQLGFAATHHLPEIGSKPRAGRAFRSSSRSRPLHCRVVTLQLLASAPDMAHTILTDDSLQNAAYSNLSGTDKAH